MSKQVKFLDIENNCIHGGIMLDNGDVICGCCGGIQPADELNETWKIIKDYGYWVDLDHEIIGDDDD